MLQKELLSVAFFQQEMQFFLLRAFHSIWAIIGHCDKLSLCEERSNLTCCKLLVVRLLRSSQRQKMRLFNNSNRFRMHNRLTAIFKITD
jgi:hypothetical protein